MVISILRCDVIVACVWNERTVNDRLITPPAYQVPVLVIDLQRDPAAHIECNFLTAGLFKGQGVGRGITAVFHDNRNCRRITLQGHVRAAVRQGLAVYRDLAARR